MKTTWIMIALIFSFSAFAQKKKDAPKARQGVTSLKPDIEFNPKKIMARVVPSQGNKVVEVITVTNSGLAGNFKLVFHDYNVTETGALDLKKFKANEKNIKYGMRDWIKYDNKPFKLEKGESKDIRFEIEVPKNAVGTKYAHFTIQPIVEINYVENREQAKKRSSAFQMKLKVVGLIILDLPGTGQKKVNLEYLFDEKIKRHMVVASNVGDHYFLTPKSSVLVMDKQNKLMERTNLIPAKTQLNPGQKQLHYGLAAKTYPPGEYNVIVTFYGDNGNFVSSQKAVLKATGAKMTTAPKSPSSKKNPTPSKKK